MFCLQSCVTSDKDVLYCTLKFDKLSRLTGSDWWQLSDKVMSLY
jgi:hypothetical protein